MAIRGAVNVWRVFYAVLWLVTLIAYSVPWAMINGEPYTGWSFTIPFSFTYLIGLLIGLIVLIIRYKPVLMTIIAGILMILGIIGAFIGFGMVAVLGGLAGAEVELGAGLGGSFLLSIIYMVAGSYAGKKMATIKTGPEQPQPTEGRIFACPRCGSSNIVGYKGEWECMDCGYKFGNTHEDVARSVKAEKVSPPRAWTNSSKGKWIAAIVIVFIIGLIFGIVVSPGQPIRQTVTTTLTVGEKVTGKTLTFSQTLTEKDLIICIGEPSVIDDWEILVKSIREIDYILDWGGYYKPKQGMKIILVDVKITNRADDIREPSVIDVLFLVTDKGKIYHDITPWDLDMLSYDEVTPNIKSKAVKYVDLNLWDELAPEAYVEGHIMFEIPIKETPHKIYITIEERWPKLAVIPIEIQQS